MPHRQHRAAQRGCILLLGIENLSGNHPHLAIAVRPLRTVIESFCAIKMTTYIVERETRKIVVKGTPETDVLPKLDALP